MMCVTYNYLSTLACHVHIAAQMLLLAKLLPLAIGDRVPTDDDRWMNFLRMREIISYIFSPHIAEDDAAYLQVWLGQCTHTHTKLIIAITIGC